MLTAVTDFTFEDLSVEEAALAAVGSRLISGQCKTPGEIVALAADADAVITQFAPVDAEAVAGLKKTRVIVRYGIGVDNVDLEAAKARNIPVCNVPDYCIDEVADQTIAFLLAMTRQVVPNCLHLRKGDWGLATPLTGMRSLCDATVGVVGFGRIGREVADRLKTFKCRRLVFDPLVGEEAVRASGCESASLERLLAESDVVTLHCPSTPKTRRMINAQSLQSMKSGALLVNVARGDLVETPALTEALKTGKLAGAALDVFDPEPLPAGHPLRSMENVIVSSHIASASVKAVRKLRTTVASIAADVLQGRPAINVVNGVGR